MKGIENFREKLPDLKGKKIVIIPLLAISTLLFSLSVMLFFDFIISDIIDLNTDYALYLPILGVLIIEVLGFFFLSLFWRNKAKFLNKDRTTAYQRGLKYVIIGVAMIVSVPVHSIIIFPINEFFLKYSITNLSESLLITIGVVPDIEIFLRLILGFIFLIIGLIGYRRVIITFGIDYMLMLYSYYPDESTIQNHSIYNVVQHPTYLSVIILAFSGFLFNFSFYTLFYLISLFLGIFFVIRRYEEKELKQRFGKPYTDYQKNVPRFIPKRNNFINYFKYLAGKY